MLVKRAWVCSACGQVAAGGQLGAGAQVAAGGQFGAGDQFGAGERFPVAADPSAGSVSPLGGPHCRNLWCAAPDRALEAVFAVGNYEGALRKAIVAYKYRWDLRWARTFGGLLYRFLARRATWFEEYAVICPVPQFMGPGRAGPGATWPSCAPRQAVWPTEAGRSSPW